MKVSKQTAELINEVINDIVSKYSTDSGNTIMTDLSFQVNPESGELTITNDDEESISSVVVDEWIDNNSEQFFETAKETLRQMILSRKQELETLSILKPYSFIMVDKIEDREAELYLVDDETVIIESEELMKGLDDDLDTFITNLLKD